jgi:ADP-ribosylarginine hydrolase
MSTEQDNKNNKLKSSKSVVLPSLILHALGDTIGFKNGDWEFNYGDRTTIITLDHVNEFIYEFIDLGGINSIDLSDWNVSDDTIFQIHVGRALLKYKGKLDEDYIINFKVSLVDALEQATKTESEGIHRYTGHTTGLSIQKFRADKDARFEEYDPKAGGNGAAMRNLVIGLCLHEEDRLEELIDVSTITSQLTHNNALGYLGGFTSAFFTSLAVRNVKITEWPYLLLEQLKSDKMVSFIKKTVSQETRDYMDFISFWEKHVENRFDKDHNLLEIKAFTNPMYRIKYYYDQFFAGTGAGQIGDTGYLGMIMAYDAVLDSGGVWEKLILFAILHAGDSDTVGAIAGGMFGAYYGYGDVPERLYEKLEFKDDIIELAAGIEKKYY